MEVEENAEMAVIEDIEKKQKLKINFAELFGEDHDDEPEQELVVVPSKTRRRKLEKERKSVADDDPPSSGSEDLSSMSVHELKSAIDRFNKNISMLSGKLSDGGAKLKAKLQCYEDELKRRHNCRSHEVANGLMKPMDSDILNIRGSLDESKRGVPSSQPSSRSKFADIYIKKMEDDNSKLEQNFKRKSTERLPESKRAKPGLRSKEFLVWKPEDHFVRYGGKYTRLHEKLADRFSSTGSSPLVKDQMTGSFTDKDGSRALDSNGSKNDKEGAEGQTVVLVDEEEHEFIEGNQEVKELSTKYSEGKIYYPSREDPKSLEILYSELKCLEHGECLTSTIMNFYVRFLQELHSPAHSLQYKFYFFNTYFYSKLQEAVSYQKSDKEAFFMRFRRWWKGVNIFQKAYIFLPINEDKHWSLVIICIPDKDGESGLTVLHLDSLGLHCSASIFDNIKSLLVNEWKILNEDVGAVNVPIPERIWENLPRKMDQRIIAVPRQTNDYDCGLFVLYYMERFIEEAPERLTRQDLNMFGRHWFKPQEASRLRGKIKKLLQHEFHKALTQDNCTWEPVCLSANAKTVEGVNQAQIS
ncbi:ubiquitin-like-specific protease 1D isoform X2 [Amaranthus tricolor]|uniref:ubiquitin-like-specific protease 1D isoform X2 n=1 Tax=Amaranthus tricolor TaxID=29722 RepID=UPI002582F868|nr:ubiquitin-like-specific protease 1D isoform X2 [Amaranthus tricolor]